MILASNSPRRRELLQAAGFVFDVRVAHTEEVWPKGPPSAGAVAVAEQKLLAAMASAPGLAGKPEVVWLAADTAVVVEGKVFGKPKDDAHAVQMLQRLAGRTHEVITGFVVAVGPNVVCRRSVSTEVAMRAYGAREIRRYVATGEPADKAGAYAVQGAGGRLVDRLYGSLSNVVGLPLSEVSEALAQVGVVPADDDVG